MKTTETTETTNRPATLAGSYRTADRKAQIEWELTHGENGPEFSASGTYDRGAGQCIDAIAKAYPSDAMVQRIARVWEVYHLNGMNAGTPKQRAYLAANPDEGGKLDAFDIACASLKAAGLYEDRDISGLRATGGFPAEVVNGSRGYRYGERWVYAEIPAEVLAEIASWSKAPQPVGSLGDATAADFLARNGVKLRITLSDTKLANWQPSGHHYRCTLSRGNRGSLLSSRLTFDFFGSVSDAEKGKDPSAYSVLACISSDATCPETFSDFCSDFGYESDSIKALQTFRRCSSFAKRLRAFFTPAEVEELSEIS